MKVIVKYYTGWFIVKSSDPESNCFLSGLTLSNSQDS